MAIVYLNSQWLEEKNAKVSVFDRGFLFADSVYEVVPAYAGNFFRFKEHIERLNRSLTEIKMDWQLSADDYHKIAQGLLDKNQLANASFYLQITRGNNPIRNHQFPTEIEPTVFAMVSELPAVVESIEHISGISAITTDDIRWDRCDIKTTGLLANCLMLQKALESGSDDTILVRQGKVLEATSSNLFMVKDGQIFTPRLGDDLLAGVTREFVIYLAKRLDFPMSEKDISVEELQAADEIWLTSSNKEIRPVVSLNHAKIGNGSIGKVWQQVNAAYQNLKSELYQGQKVKIEGIETYESKL